MAVSPESIYLTDIPLPEAIAGWHRALNRHSLLIPRGSETVRLEHALGRITAQPVWARLSSPHYHASAMDGYAVRAQDTHGASETQPLTLALDGAARYVDTGDPLPAGMNAVIPIENVHLTGQGIEILAAVAPWAHVRAMGEDIVASELVLPVHHRIRPQDLGALAAAGSADVVVHMRPRVAILPTGSELVPPGSEVKAGDIIEFNTLVLGAMAEEAGAVVTRYPITPDVYDQIKAQVLNACATHDLVLVNAGSSRGSEDFTSRVFAEIGEVNVHGVAIRPGHPVILGASAGHGHAVALAGIPGYPVSAVLTFELFCQPLLLRWQGQPEPQRLQVQATLSRKWVSPLGDDEYVRVALGRVGDKIVAAPLAGGAGVITSLVKADGVLKVPRFQEGHHQGSQVNVSLLTTSERMAHSVLCIGSHDMTLDVLANQLRAQAMRDARAPVHLSCAHVGSLGGLLALQRGEAHMAGCHLLDEDSGEYNTSWVRKYLSDHGIPAILIGFVQRVQGLIVPPGNPKQLHRLQDLTRPDVAFVNRQRGAGTRVLLDYKLAAAGIGSRDIAGYARQEYTHLGVAAAVASGAADCGLGILGAARALGMAFVPLFEERYDLVIPTAHVALPLMQPVFDAIRSSEFSAAVLALGGYETPNMGKVLASL